jgi:mono/diheme cytochrome c family protein
MAACLCALCCAACSGRPEPTREWRPEDHGQPQQADPSRTPADEAEVEQGGADRAAEALFSMSCAGCHGQDGRGRGPQRPPGATLPDFGDPNYQASRTNEQLSVVIRDGRGLMPPFGKQLNPQGVEVLVARIRRFAAH